MSSKSSNASDDSRATLQKRPISPQGRTHKLFICKERSILDGAEYTVLDHQLDAVEFTALTEQQVRVAMTTITETASDAIDELNAFGSGLRREQAQWITIDQLTEWLSTEEQFKNIDVYSFISKILSFLAYYQTPVVHKGMCVIAGSPMRRRLPLQRNIPCAHADRKISTECQGCPISPTSTKLEPSSTSLPKR